MTDVAEKSIKDIKGIGHKTAKDLEESGRGTIKKLATANPDKLPEYTGLGEKKAHDVVMKAREELQGGSRFQSGLDLEQEQENMGTITTGSNKFDGLLKGGIGVGYTTEAYGKSSSGKTQLALQLAVNNQLPEITWKCPECRRISHTKEEYIDNPCCDNRPLPEDFEDKQEFENNVKKKGHNNGDKVIFIDTEDTFMSSRVRQMAEAQGLDSENVLDNIYHTAPTDLPDQEQAVEDCRELDLEDVGLIVIDSIIAHIRNQFKGRAEYGERADRLGDMLTELKKLASGHELAVFYTNQAGDDPGVQYGDSTYAVGGNIMKHSSSFRIKLDDRQSKGFNAELIDSPHLPQNDVYYEIFAEGIRDTDFESEMEDDDQ